MRKPLASKVEARVVAKKQDRKKLVIGAVTALLTLLIVSQGIRLVLLNG